MFGPHLLYVATGNCRFPGAYIEKKSVTLPVQCFDSVSSSSAEQKQRRLEWIHLELGLDHTGQTVDAASQICVSASYVDRTATIEIVQHALTA